jgi:hypothetical protein
VAAGRGDGRQDAHEVELALAGKHEPFAGSQDFGKLVGSGSLGGFGRDGSLESGAGSSLLGRAESRSPTTSVRPIIHSPEVHAATARSSPSPKALIVASKPTIRTGGQASSNARRGPRTAGTNVLGRAW